MNRYKRITLVLLAVLLSVGLYACKNINPLDKEPQTDYMICEGLYLKGKSDHLIIIENQGPVVMHDKTQSDGKIFDGRSLEAYQTAKNDVCVIYYELGLAEDSPSTIEGLSARLLSSPACEGVARLINSEVCRVTKSVLRCVIICPFLSQSGV